MILKKFIWVIITFIIYVQLSATVAFAVTAPPTFPNCSNPQGSLKVSYNSGSHGIVGASNEQSGSDSVYTLSDDTLTQCFCAVDGSGIQTNWWKISSFSEDEIKVLKSEGWYLIPDGSLWGLDPGPYLAINKSYSCESSNTGGGTGGSNSNSSNGGGSTGTGGGTSGNILAAATSNVGDILGLASTGDSVFVYTMGFMGFSFLTLGIYLRSKKN